MSKVSIIVPVYNVEKYLDECLNSILNQTYNNFELILINDGSTDRSGVICDEYKKKHANIKVIHQENQGQAAARNNGVKISESEWIMFVDSDDVVHPQILEYLVRAARESGSNLSACGLLQDENLPVDFYKKSIFSYDIMHIEDAVVADMHNSNNEIIKAMYWIACTKLLKKHIVEKYPFFEGKIYEDNEVTPKWLVEAQNIAVVPKNLYFYRTNPTSTVNKKFSLKKLDYLWSLESKIEYFRTIGYYKSQRVIMSDYFYSAVFLSKQIETELQRPDIVKKLMRQTYKKYRSYYNKYKIHVNKATLNYMEYKVNPLQYITKQMFKRIKKFIKRIIKIR